MSPGPEQHERAEKEDFAHLSERFWSVWVKSEGNGLNVGNSLEKSGYSAIKNALTTTNRSHFRLLELTKMSFDIREIN